MSIAVYAFANRVLMSFSVDKTLLPRKVNLSSRRPLFSVDMSPTATQLRTKKILRRLQIYKFVEKDQLFYVNEWYENIWPKWKRIGNP